MASQEGKLHFDDLAVGMSFTSGFLDVRKEDILRFAREFDPQPFHLDETQATATLFKGLAASGWHTAAMTMRLLVDGGLPLATGIIGAGTELSWPKPVRPGDRLHVVSTVQELAPSKSKPDRGMALCVSETFNQAGEVVQVLRSRLIVMRLPG